MAYSFEAVLTDEFYNRELECAPSQLVPNGPGYTNSAYQGCAVTGADVGSLSVPGSRYLSESFGYSRSNLWRNFGVCKCDLVFSFYYQILIISISDCIYCALHSGYYARLGAFQLFNV